jgi:Tol biopolymer transport system component
LLFVPALAAAACAVLQPSGDVETNPEVDAGNGEATSHDDAAVPDAAGEDVDAGTDAALPACNVDLPFGKPSPLSNVNAVGAADLLPRLSPDELTLTFASSRTPGTPGTIALYVATRPSVTSAFGTPVLLNPPGGNSWDPTVSPDGLWLVFARNIDGGDFDLREAHRPTTSALWLNSTPIAPPISMVGTFEAQPFIAWDQKTLWFTSNRLGSADIYVAATDGGAYGPPAPVPGLSDPAEQEQIPVPNADGSMVFFTKTIAGNQDIYVARRVSDGGDGYEVTGAVSELNSPATDGPGWLSRDGCRLYFMSDRQSVGDVDMWVASRPP